jgi:hypothetical protein
MTPAYRADKARQLLEDPILTEAFQIIEAKALKEAMNVPAWAGVVGDRKRRRALERIKLISELRSQLDSVIREGKQAARPASGVA